jgi:hypothetical protein
MTRGLEQVRDVLSRVLREDPTLPVPSSRELREAIETMDHVTSEYADLCALFDGFHPVGGLVRDDDRHCEWLRFLKTDTRKMRIARSAIERRRNG